VRAVSTRPIVVFSVSGRTAAASCWAVVRALPAASVARVRASLTARSAWTWASPGKASALERNWSSTVLARSTASSRRDTRAALRCSRMNSPTWELTAATLGLSPTEPGKPSGETVVTTGRTVAEQLVERSRTPLLAVVGAGDLAVKATKDVVDTLRSRAEALPGEAQVQADLAAKEARTRATEAAQTARTRVHEVRVATRPDVVLGTVSTLVDVARTQVEALAERGAGVVEELRRQPGFRKVVRRAEEAVDTVEDALEDILEETAETVAEASDEVTSVAQKAAAKTAKAAQKAEDKVEDVAESAKATVRSAEETDASTKAAAKAAAPVKTAPARKSTPAAATKAPAKATTTRVSRARTAKRTDPTAVPAKKN
jgi:heparin binding hemagglutinin HbhA